MNFGIDKIGLHTTDYQVREFNREYWGTKSNQAPNQDELPCIIKDIKGNEVRASNAYHNSQIVNVDINQRGLLVTLNPSKKYHSYHLTSDMDKINDVLEIVDSHLYDIGLNTSIKEMKLTRVDITKQAEMRNPTNMYGKVYGFLKGKRMTGVQYPNGYRFGNKSTEITCYDKGLQHYDIHKELIPERNLMRGEVKYKKHTPVAKNMGITYAKDILNLTTDDLNNNYNDFMLKRVFSKMNDGVQLSIDYQNEKELFVMIDSQGRNGIERYLSMLGLDEFIEKWGSLENFKIMLDDIGWNRQRVYDTIKKINERMQQKAFIDARSRGNSFSNLYQEIREKFTTSIAV